jgi:hypothetical protein
LVGSRLERYTERKLTVNDAPAPDSLVATAAN